MTAPRHRARRNRSTRTTAVLFMLGSVLIASTLSALIVGMSAPALAVLA